MAIWDDWGNPLEEALKAAQAENERLRRSIDYYLVPPVWLIVTDLSQRPRSVARARRRVDDALYDYLLDGGPVAEMCANSPSCGWFTQAQLGGPGLFNWMRRCLRCGFWWRDGRWS